MAGQWFSPGTPVASIIKTDRHGTIIMFLLLKLQEKKRYVKNIDLCAYFE